MKPTYPILALAALALSACSKAPEQRTADAPISVTVARVESRALASGITASGVLIPREEAGVSADGRHPEPGP